MGNRLVFREAVKGVEVCAAVFDGEDMSTKGEVALSFQARCHDPNFSHSEIRTYCRAADLDRLGRALIAAAEDIRSREGE